MAPDGEPQAELWMGDHPLAPSRLVAADQGLDEAAAADPRRVLGPAVADNYGRLPFLFKVLAAAAPLSIQTHPSKQEAETGFARENGTGVPLDARRRMYRDDNHKPELICALTPFRALCGFRSLDRVRAGLETTGSDGLDELRRRLVGEHDAQVLEGLVGWLLALNGREVGVLVDELVGHGRSEADVELVQDLARRYPGDPGALVALLLNPVTLEPGQALFLPAGNVHAYLEGVGVELMANSDNVVRGGLTSKPIDVDELLRIARFEPLDPEVQTPSSPLHRYASPGAEFALTRIELAGPARFDVEGPEIVLVVDGRLELRAADGTSLGLRRGEVGFVPAADRWYEASGTGLAFRASVQYQASR